MQPLTKRQREILDFLGEFIEQHGYAPSLEEIGRRFGLSSLATVHKHLANLQDKGFIKRAWNRSRSVELVSTRVSEPGPWTFRYSAAWPPDRPIEAVVSDETVAVPEDLVGARDTYALRVQGDSMIDEQIRDGDVVIVEDRKTAENGEMVIALLGGSEVTLKKFYREQRTGQAPTGQPAAGAAHRRCRPRADPGRRRRRHAKILIVADAGGPDERAQASELHDRARRDERTRVRLLAPIPTSAPSLTPRSISR